MKKTFIIAEIGVNHNNSIKLAKKLIIEAKIAGCDAVKFQTFKASTLVRPNTKKVPYQKISAKDKEDHYQLIKKLELNEKDHFILKKFCSKKKIQFISTPYDVQSAKFLNKLKVNIFKTASADLHDFELHDYISKTKKHVIISTGMSTIKDIKKTLSIYKKNNSKNYSLLHCTSNYPCSYQSVNLNVLEELKKYSSVVGYSDHTLGSLTSCMAVGLGGQIIEKHFTLNKKMKGPDHKASADPKELKELVKNIRTTEKILGSRNKAIQLEERDMLNISKKGLYFAENLNSGTKLTRKHILNIRPANSLTSFDIKKFVGKKLKKNVLKFKPLNKRCFK
jgi:sialic acid synthase SpsE|tara:strand:+ start:877 stop:1884 length:1008 start_codon:yes stop_codon:yes gene_type:complete